MVTAKQSLPLADHIEAARLLCIEAGDWTLLNQSRRPLLVAAVRDHDTATLFEWLMTAFSFQGVSDTVAAQYMANRPTPSYGQIIAGAAPCPKLRSYWHFDGCNYHKGTRTCAEPERIDDCSLPSLDLRNGRLNQTTFALAYFIRDVAGGDMVDWIDTELAAAAPGDSTTRPRRLAQCLIAPMRGVYGISDKVLNMALSDLLLGAGKHQSHWLEAGGAMIAIDSLVHNWLHRTGALHATDCLHEYGEACYRDGGCRDLVEYFAERIDASAFNPSYPSNFPRFVQKAIWAFCSQAGLARCNGVMIDDRRPCEQNDCPIWSKCARKPLKPAKTEKA